MLLPSLPLRFALILGLFATLCTARVGLAQKPPPDAVERMLARSDAVFSGRYTYTLLSGVDRTKKPIPFELIYSGPSWKRTEKQLAADVEMTFSEDLIKSGFDPKKVKPLQGYREITNVSHKGKFYVFTANPQLDGGMRHALRVTTGEQPLEKQFLPLPPFLGGFWFS